MPAIEVQTVRRAGHSALSALQNSARVSAWPFALWPPDARGHHLSTASWFFGGLMPKLIIEFQLREEVGSIDVTGR
jgi:hypothetical protein